MAVTIKITPQELDDIAAQFRRVAAEQDVLTQTTIALVERLISVFQSESPEAKVRNLVDLLNNDQQKIQVLIELADALTKASDILKNADASIASAFKA